MFCTRTTMMRESTVDPDKIEKGLRGELKGRNSGRTFTSCYLLAKEIERGEETLIDFIVREYRDAYWVLPMIARILEDCTGLFIDKFNKDSMSFKCNGVTVRFLSTQSYMRRRVPARHSYLMFAK